MATDDDKLVLRSPVSPPIEISTSTYGGGFCVLPWASLVAASGIRLKNPLFISCFSISPAKHLPAADCTLTALTKPKSDIWPLMRMSGAVATAVGFFRHWKPRRLEEKPGKSF